MEQRSFDVDRVLSILRDRWKLVTATTVLAVLAAAGYVFLLATPSFETRALVTYQPPRGDVNPTGGALPSNNLTAENVQTLIGNATSEEVVDAAVEAAGEAGHEISADGLRGSVAVEPNGESSQVSFVARADSAERAAALANAWAEAFVADRQQGVRSAIQPELEAASARADAGAGAEPGTAAETLAADARQEAADLARDQRQWARAISVSNPASEPSIAAWPRTKLTLVAAVLVGIGLGIIGALLTARVDRRVRGGEFDELPAPVLVRVPESTRASRTAPLAPSAAEPIVADSFAALGARVMLGADGQGAHVVLVTSARSGEGKSSVSANLASALALSGRRVVLLDADMRRSTQGAVFPVLRGRPGLSQVLTRGAELESALTLVAPNLAGIGAGPRHEHASVLLASVAFRQLVDRLGTICESIVIDAPPVLAVNDALAVAPAADQVLLCARVGTSDLDEVEQAHSRIAAAAHVPQAMVLVGTRRPEGYGYDDSLAPAAPGTRPTAFPSQGAPGAQGAPAGAPEAPSAPSLDPNGQHGQAARGEVA